MLRSVSTGIAVACLLGSLVCGCMTSGPRVSDEERVIEALTAWKAGTEAQDLEAMMAAFSERFYADAAPGKAQLRESLGQALEEGHFEDVEVDIEGVEVVIEGTKASVAPVSLTGVFGAVQVSLSMAQEADGCWRIIGLDPY